MNNPNYNRRINERIRRRRRRATVLTIFFFVIILLSLLSVFAVLQIREHLDDREENNPPDITDQTVQTTEPADQTTTAPIEQTTAAPETDPPAPLVTYTTVTLTRDAITQGDLILVNADLPYTFPLTEGHLTTVYGNKSRGYQLGSAQDKLDTDVLAALNTAADAFLAETGETGLLLANNGAYRSYAAQEDLYARRVTQYGEEEAAKYVALPGVSEHHTGLAFDLALYIDGKTYALDAFDAYDWIPENFPRYGFILRYPANKIAQTGIGYEPWHFRYVGIPHAVYMTANNLCLEEYINVLRAYQATGEHLFVESDGRRYEIWYVPFAVEADTTSILIPDGVPYSISGNNRDGFIVTLTHNSTAQ